MLQLDAKTVNDITWCYVRKHIKTNETLDICLYGSHIQWKSAMSQRHMTTYKKGIMKHFVKVLLSNLFAVIMETSPCENDLDNPALM